MILPDMWHCHDGMECHVHNTTASIVTCSLTLPDHFLAQGIISCVAVGAYIASDKCPTLYVVWEHETKLLSFACAKYVHGIQINGQFN